MAASDGSLGELYSKCVQMVNENKVSSKNAFDLKLIDNMDELVNMFMGGKKKSRTSTSGRVSVGGGEGGGGLGSTSGADEAEHRFHEASHAIEASARIYAVRVDSVHTDTYKVLGGLSAADFGDDDNQDESKGPAKKRRIVGVNTLERNETNITLQNLDADEQSDPMFRRMAAAFDAGGAKGLLLGHLPIAEDLSLVFNGDVPLTRAAKAARTLFATPQMHHVRDLGMGDPDTALRRVAGSRLCSGLDEFRQTLWGKEAGADLMLPKSLEMLLGPQPGQGAPARALPSVPPPPLVDMDDGAYPVEADHGEDLDDLPPACEIGTDPHPDFQAPDGLGGSSELPMPLQDAQLPDQDECRAAGMDEDVVAFDDLFEKFCGGAGAHQFAYFDECWGKGNDKGGDGIGVLADTDSAGGALVAAVAPEPKEKMPKRPLFDLADIDKPVKPIETEPSQKHQLSDRALQWQLHKDVPPYMIDRITMPSWPTWSKCDFACLGLRPHLMLKLVRKTPPADEGPHSFSDLFSTVVVENPDAFPWLKARESGAADDGDDPRAEQAGDVADDVAEEDFDDSGLPSHLDADPGELFLRPDDHVVPACDGDADGDLGGDAGDYAADEGDDPFAGVFGNGAGDFDMVDQPTTCGSTDIGYSRNSKFVDVKLVKKHLWDCISEDLAKGPKGEVVRSVSFQSLVDRTVQRMPASEMENLSTQVCFICALHLCNEKDLELEVGDVPLGDFAISGMAT